jgi:hypothetical protein
MTDTAIIEIDGDLIYGETLTATLINADNAVNINYQWLISTSNWAIIPAENDATILITKSHVGKQLRVFADYIDQEGINRSSISAPTEVIININSPGTIQVNGVFIAGETLTAVVEDDDGLTNAVITYLWQSTIDEINWIDIENVTSSTLELSSDLIGEKLRVIASYTDDLGTAEVVTSEITDEIIPSPEPGIAFISGIIRQHNTLTVVIEDLNGVEEDSVTYLWEHSVDGYEWIETEETENTLYLSREYFNKFVRVLVQYTTGIGNQVEIYSDRTPLIAEPLSKASYLGSSNPYDFTPTTNAVFTFHPPDDWMVDEETGNSIPVPSTELILCTATVKQKKDPNLAIQPGIDYNRVYFEGYLSEPNTLVDTEQSKNVTAVINSRLGIFDFVPILESVEEINLKQRDRNGQLIAGYFKFT